MVDEINIKDLTARCIIGVNDWERKEKQEVVINIKIYADLKGTDDDITKTIDYKKIKKSVLEFVEKSRFYLLEKLADEVALLCIRQGAREVEVEIDKPGALRFARSVSVKIKRKISEVFVAVGSNISPEKNIPKALEILSKKVKIKDVSTFWKTEPIGMSGPEFYNGAVKLETHLTFAELEEILKSIERKLGRRKGKWKPRPIDLDIVFFEGVENEKCPHPDVFERLFVALPLYELKPNLVISGIPISKLVRDLQWQKDSMEKIPKFREKILKLIAGK